MSTLLPYVGQGPAFVDDTSRTTHSKAASVKPHPVVALCGNVYPLSHREGFRKTKV